MFKWRKQNSKKKELKLKWEILKHDPAPVETTYGSATLVGDRIYVAGYNSDLAVLSCSVGKWENYGTCLFELGRGHVAELVEDKIYYFGGEYFDGLVEVDTVLDNSVRKVEMFNEGPSAREYMTSVFASWRNQMITFGGEKYRFSNEVHALDLETKAWTKLVLRGEAPERRTSHSATLLGTKMYIYGGYTDDETYVGDLWIAELGNQCAPYWSMVKTEGTSPPPRRARLNNLKGVLILFGSSLWSRHGELHVYVPKENEWDDGSGPNITITNASLIERGVYISVTTPQGIMYIKSGKNPCLLREDIA